MSAKAAREAIYTRLAATDWSALAAAPVVVWQNTTNSGTRPRIEVAAAAEGVAPIPITGPSSMLTASIVLTAVGDVGEGERTLGPLVQAIVDRFPVNELVGDTRIITATAAAPFLDGSEMRVPVSIRYRAIV